MPSGNVYCLGPIIYSCARLTFSQFHAPYRTSTASCFGTRHAGFLPEPGCWIPVQRAKRHGVGTQQLICEHASETCFSEAQDVKRPHQKVGAQSVAKAV